MKLFLNLSASVASLAFLISCASGALSSSRAAASPVEVVQSFPIETSLAVPGVRLTQDVWVEMIGAARQSLDFEEFYISESPGQSLDPVLSAMKDACSRGVQIRFMIDSKFLKSNPHEAEPLLAQVPCVDLRVVDYTDKGGGIQHAKFLVADQSQVFVGSANFDWLALSHIHEIGLKIADAAVASRLESVFAKDWEDAEPYDKKSAKPAHAPSPVGQAATAAASGDYRLVASPAARNPDGVSDTLSAITSLIGSAQSSVKIQVYEYNTKPSKGGGHWSDLDNAIRAAAARGAHVQLLVDAVALKAGKADLKALAGLKNVEVRKVVIPEWSGGHLDYARLVHSKYMVIDGSQAWVGTENWSEGYFDGCRNVGIALKLKDVSSRLGDIFDHVWSSQYASAI